MAIVGKTKNMLGFGFFAAYLALNGFSAMAVPYYQMHRFIDPLALSVVLCLPIVVGMVLSKTLTKHLLHHSEHKGVHCVILALGCATAVSFIALWFVPQSWSLSAQIITLVGLVVFYSLVLNGFIILLKLIVFNLAEQCDDHTVFDRTTLFEKVGSLMYFWLFPVASLSLWGTLDNGVAVVAICTALVLILAPTLILFNGLPTSLRLENHTENRPSGAVPDKQSDWIFAVVFIQFGLIGACVSVDFYLLVYYVAENSLNLGSQLKGLLSSGYAIAGVIWIPVVRYLAVKTSNLEALCWVFMLMLLGSVIKWFIYTPAGSDFILLDALIGAAIWSAIATLVPSLLTQINSRQKGRFSDVVAKHHVVINFSLVFALVTSGAMLNLIGFDASNEVQTEQTITLMRFILSIGSFIATALALTILIKVRVYYRPTRGNNNEI